jgi:hypothetical protein
MGEILGRVMMVAGSQITVTPEGDLGDKDLSRTGAIVWSPGPRPNIPSDLGQRRGCISMRASASLQQAKNPRTQSIASSVLTAEVTWPTPLAHIGRRARETQLALEPAFSLGADLIQMPASAGLVHGTPQIRPF